MRLKNIFAKWGVAGIKESFRRKKLRRERRRLRIDVAQKAEGGQSQSYLPSDGGGNKIDQYLEQRFGSADRHKVKSEFYIQEVTEGVDASRAVLKCIAFYLPQFHPIPENDQWWGKGFTEWTNVSKAQPQFVGHRQPRLPSDLGFYDLRLPNVLAQQVALAQKYGIHGFCFHYYWFGGKRLLETPVNNFLQDKSLDLNFCYCWANENWTRRWDGLDQDVLIAQNHSPEDDLAFIDQLIESFQDERYIKIDDKPVLIVYRVSDLPDAKATAMRWRERVLARGLPGIYLVAARSFDINDPRVHGFDAAVEFPPHQTHPIDLTEKISFVNESFKGAAYDYPELAETFGLQTERDFRLFKTVMPSWDNEARKPGRGHVFVGSSPPAYVKWLKNAMKVTNTYPASEQLLFINAWNEWSEGAYLEPDQVMGHAYLKATGDCIRQQLLDENSRLSSEAVK